jgi:hypothetical protein
MAMLRRHLPFAAVAAVLLVASVAAVADTDENNPRGAGVPQITEIEPEARAAMAVLDEPRGEGDALSAYLDERIDAHADFGMNPALSRLSIGNLSSSVYVIPADDHVCAVLTVGDGANLSCPSTEAIATGQAAAATVVLENGDIAVYGLVPDGVDSVAVGTGTSGSTEVEASSNAYYTVVQAGTPLRTVAYSGPSGAVEFPIYDPSLVGEEPSE